MSIIYALPGNLVLPGRLEETVNEQGHILLGDGIRMLFKGSEEKRGFMQIAFVP